MRRLVDPIRMYDAKLRPLASYDAMEKRIKLLEHQNARLVRILRGQSLRNGPNSEQEIKPVIH